MAYLMDSNAFIQAKNQFYRFSFCPGYWDWIAQEHGAGRLFSVEKVEEELKERADELSEWAQNTAPAGFFVAPSLQVATTQAVIARWVNAQPFAQDEKVRFLGGTDPWLIAEAIDSGRTIITFEQLVPANSSKVKIPNVAANFGAQWASLYDAIELSGAQLRL
jgi:hypothetical protein